MILLIAAAVTALGVMNLLFRQTLLGLMVGVQLIAIGAAMMFVLAGILSGARVEGHLFGLFVAWMSLAQLAGGYAVAIRLFYLRKKITLDELRALKR